MQDDKRPPTYLDWAATAPLRRQAADAIADAAARLATGEWANPSSVHASGRAARRALAAARAAIAEFAGVSAASLVFTSGATEALAGVIRGWRGPVLVGATEHAAALEAAPDAARLAVDRHGRIEPFDMPEGALVVVQQANNETGVLQDVAALARRVHDGGGTLLCDCVQSAGKLAAPPADMLALSAHKMGGPAGVGALVLRCGDGIQPLMRGGGQEGGLRGGTENLLGILGWAAALGAWERGWPDRAAALRTLLEERAVAAGALVNGSGAPRLPTISSLHLPGVPAATQLMALDMAGVAVSQGAACSSGTLSASRVLAAMGLGRAAGESIRVSLGWSTTADDIERFFDAWLPLASRARAHAA